jgi:hypothetical protein
MRLKGRGVSGVIYCPLFKVRELIVFKSMGVGVGVSS